MEKDNVILARRTSGGGAVYQDLGNTNFTFLSGIHDYNKNQNSQIIINALSQFGVKAETSGRNDILVNGMKISGSAYKISGMKAFHHGTLLINVNMNALQNYLNPNKLKLQSKGVASVRARVINLQEVNPQITHEALSKAIIEEFFKFYNDSCEIENLDSNFLKEQKLLDEVYHQYQDWNWRFGETPQFDHNLEHKFEWGLMDVHINSKDGIIEECKIFSDSLYPAMIEEMNKALTKARYDKESISEALDIASRNLENSPETKEAAKCVEEFKEWFIHSL